MSELIIDSVYGWREDDYDGYNDYYVNPEYHRSETTRKRVEQQDEEDDEQRTTTQETSRTAYLR